MPPHPYTNPNITHLIITLVGLKYVGANLYDSQYYILLCGLLKQQKPQKACVTSYFCTWSDTYHEGIDFTS
jgi:hypothetical protein